MQMPPKMKPDAYRAMVEARPERRSRWLPILEELAKDTPPPRERRPSPLIQSPFPTKRRRQSP
jgi:hypothetical protein